MLCSGVGREIAASKITGPRDTDPTSSHISDPSPVTNIKNNINSSFLFLSLSFFLLIFVYFKFVTNV